MELEGQGSPWDKATAEIELIENTETGQQDPEIKIVKTEIVDNATKELLNLRFADYKIQTNKNIEMRAKYTPEDETEEPQLFFTEYPKQAKLMARSLEIYAWQYIELLRAQLTEFDPLVLEYVERILDTTNAAKTSTEEAKSRNYSSDTDRTQGGTEIDALSRNLSDNITLKQTGTGTIDRDIDETGGTTNTRTLNTDEKLTGQDSVAGSGKDINAASGTDTQERRGYDEVTSVGDTQNLMANTPQSAVNQNTGNYPGTSTGAPEEAGRLDWTYQDNQQEEKRKGLDKTTYNSDTSTIHGKTDTLTYGKTDTTTYGKNTHQGGTITDKLTRDNQHTDQIDTETRDFTDTTNRTQGGTEDRTLTRNLTDSTITTQEDSAKKSIDTLRTDNGQNRERIKRTGNPAELLEQAKSYIAGTNAFLWLCDKIEPCFLAVWQEDEEEGVTI